MTPEDAPLAALGHRASETVSSLADEWRIAIRTRRYPISHDAGQLETQPGPTLAADEAVALPRLRGPALDGLPSDAEGFLPTDEHARVRGVDDVNAVGDATTFPVKQGGIAAQQADVAAEAVAALFCLRSEIGFRRACRPGGCGKASHRHPELAGGSLDPPVVSTARRCPPTTRPAPRRAKAGSNHRVRRESRSVRAAATESTPSPGLRDRERRASTWRGAS